MVGMRDVAKKAGVSLSTVSLVVNNSGYVSDDMRARVESAMKDLNYIPNELARNLYRDRTDIVGVVVPSIRHPFFSALISAIHHEFSDHDLHMMLCSTSEGTKGEKEYVDMLRRHMVDGIIMASHTDYPPEYWTSIGRPVVAFDRYLGDGIPAVGSDHDRGGRLIAEHLLKTGVRHVVAMGGPRSQFVDYAGGMGTTFPTVRFHTAMEGLLSESGVRYDYVEVGDVAEFGMQRKIALSVLDRYPDADVIVGADHVVAYCAQEAIRRGIRIPDDLQIVAYDGTFVADAAGVALTCVRQDCRAIARRLVHRLLQAREAEGGKLDASMVGIVGVGPEDDLSPHDITEAMDLIPVTFVQGDSTRH